MRRTRSDYTHIRYEWEDSHGSSCSQTTHMLDPHSLAWWGIPEKAKQVPCKYDYEKERWIDA